jgi:hypothetical protein
MRFAGYLGNGEAAAGEGATKSKKCTSQEPISLPAFIAAMEVRTGNSIRQPHFD